MLETTSFAINTEREIGSQPEMWRRAIEQARAGTPLPAAGERVLFLGCGTSYYVGDAYARLRNELGLGRTRASIPSELDYVDDDEVVIVLSRSGTTGDVVAIARELVGSHRVIGLVGTSGSPLIAECTDVIMLDYADEVSVVQTRFATTAFTLLRASLTDGVDFLVDQAREALARELPSAPDHVVFLGHGVSVGLAHEAALKCLESSGRWAEAYPVLEYQHGPISAASSPNTLVWPLLPIAESIAEAIRAAGATLVEPSLDPQAELVAIHRLAVSMAAAAGRNPDVPHFLSRSVISD
ncbi:SIS domain-containing protein [Glaciihabitans sp. UYNi722]|uniref:SIS domain-containing protein n=1 Tax=Glaciihabitans sp. UYNi722 TaxID=3156344 RepID=UPI003398248D